MGTSATTSVDAIGPVVRVCECSPMVGGGIELAEGIVEEEAIDERQGRKEEGGKRNRWTKRFKLFSLLLLNQRFSYDDEINDLGAGSWDLNPEALSAKRHYEEEG